MTLGGGGGSTGAAGAFAPVNFQQWVHCTRPDAELSYKCPFFIHKEAFWCKNGVQFLILEVLDHHFTLKKCVCTRPVRSLAPPLKLMYSFFKIAKVLPLSLHFKFQKYVLAQNHGNI